MANDGRKTIQEQLAEAKARGLLQAKNTGRSENPISTPSNASSSQKPHPRPNDGSRFTQRQQPLAGSASHQNRRLEEENEILKSLGQRLEQRNMQLLEENEQLKIKYSGADAKLAVLFKKEKEIESLLTDIDKDSAAVAEQKIIIENNQKSILAESTRIQGLLNDIQTREGRLAESLKIHEQNLDRLYLLDQKENSINCRELVVTESEQLISNKKMDIAAQEKVLEAEKERISRAEIRHQEALKKLSALKKENRDLYVSIDLVSKERARLQVKHTKALKGIKDANDRLMALAPFHIENWDTADWILCDIDIDHSIFPKTVSCEGDGPWQVDDLNRMLKQHRFKVGKCGAKDAAEILIVGRSNWNTDFIDRHITNRGDADLYIFPQELFVASVLSGKNPFQEKDDENVAEMLELFGRGHPVIEWLRSLQFPWPDIGFSGEPNTTETERVTESPLVKIGYRVGVSNDQPEPQRRKILAMAFNDELPFVESEEYMDGWSEAGTRLRLRRIAWHIAMQIRSFRSRKNYHVAVKEWESDLNWLRRTYYKPFMRFIWP